MLFVGLITTSVACLVPCGGGGDEEVVAVSFDDGSGDSVGTGEDTFAHGASLMGGSVCVLLWSSLVLLCCCGVVVSSFLVLLSTTAAGEEEGEDFCSCSMVGIEGEDLDVFSRMGGGGEGDDGAASSFGAVPPNNAAHDGGGPEADGGGEGEAPTDAGDEECGA